MASTRRSSLPRLLGSAAVVLLGALPSLPAFGATIIKRPGLHPLYKFEFEPHLVLALTHPNYADEGIGLGAQFGIPIVDQGPITTINNSMAIGVGLDFIHYSDCGYWWDGRGGNRYDCSSNALYTPVVLQWNFYITDIITVFGEPGLGFRYTWWDWDGNCDAWNCDENNSHLEPMPVLETGAKFMFGKKAGLTVRIGYPHMTVGASLLF
jgi:hypothetical protein